MAFRGLRLVVGSIVAVAALVVLPWPEAARADFQTTTLDKLIGKTVDVGPLQFTDFAYQKKGVDQPDASTIVVSPINVAHALFFGLLFSSNWFDSTDDGAFQDARIAFTVQTTGPDIDAASLFAFPLGVVPPPVGPSDGSVTITESLLIVAAGNVPTNSAYSFWDGNMGDTVNGDVQTFQRRATVQTVTSILLSNEGGRPFVEGIAETFRVVPEPPTAVLTLLAAPLLLAVRASMRRHGAVAG